jgi:tetratricopeptide (TPR) repeat protein
MEIRAGLFHQRAASVFPARAALSATSRLPVPPSQLASRLANALAVSAVAFLFLTSSLPAQQATSPDNAPGWPIANPMPGHGRVIPQPTDGLERPDAPVQIEESCSLWAAEGLQRSTVSAAMLQIPGKSRDQYHKACADAQAKRFNAAEDHLHKAVEVSPKYTAAWVLLGQVLIAKGQPAEAQNACSRASAVDSRDIPAYLCLAHVAGQQNNWSQSLDMAGRALALAPEQPVYAHFYSAVAQFHLGQLADAERSALQAVDADQAHHVPRIYLLLAQMCAAKHDRGGAVAQLRAFLKLAPNSPESPGVRQSLAQLENQSPK